MIKTALIASILMAFQGVSFGHEEKTSSPLKISRLIDSYFRTNINSLNTIDTDRVFISIPEVRFNIFSEDDLSITDWDETNLEAIDKASSLSSFVLAAIYAF